MDGPAPSPAPEAAAIAYGARTSILAMAWAGLLGYFILTLLLVALLLGDQELRRFVLAGALYGAYGFWVFLKLHRCGRKLTPDGAQLAEAMELHRQFWNHAPFVSACSIPIAMAIFWPGFQGR
jgi:hypothetical protein